MPGDNRAYPPSGSLRAQDVPFKNINAGSFRVRACISFAASARKRGGKKKKLRSRRGSRPVPCYFNFRTNESIDSDRSIILELSRFDARVSLKNTRDNLNPLSRWDVRERERERGEAAHGGIAYSREKKRKKKRKEYIARARRDVTCIERGNRARPLSPAERKRTTRSGASGVSSLGATFFFFSTRVKVYRRTCQRDCTSAEPLESPRSCAVVCR